jgi:hypothetical protein
MVKVMESNTPPLKNGARIRAVAEQSVTLIVSCEDLTLALDRRAKHHVGYLG